MPDNQHDTQENQPSYIPASFEKRTAAWMGVAYALMFLFIITFAIFTGGKELPGTFPLFLVPVAVAACVISIYRQIKGTAPGGIVTTVVVVLCCVFGVVLGLAMGIPALAAALTNPLS